MWRSNPSSGKIHIKDEASCCRPSDTVLRKEMTMRRVKNFLEGVFCVGMVIAILTAMSLLIYGGLTALQ